jgi:DNA polymerase elongation subunit (family B)
VFEGTCTSYTSIPSIVLQSDGSSIQKNVTVKNKQFGLKMFGRMGTPKEGYTKEILFIPIQPYTLYLSKTQTEAGAIEEMNKFCSDFPTIVSASIERMRPFLYYSKPLLYIKLVYPDNSSRNEHMRTVEEYTTAHDDKSYINVATRDYQIQIAGARYTFHRNNVKRVTPYQSDRSYHVIELSDLNIPDPSISETIIPPFKVMAFDIETYSADGKFTVPENPHHRLFMIGVATADYRNIVSNQPTEFTRYCFTDIRMANSRIAKNEDIHVKIGATERDILIDFIDCIARYQPDFIVGFNDIQFDWPWIVYRIKQHKLLTEFCTALNMEIPWTCSEEGEEVNWYRAWEDTDDPSDILTKKSNGAENVISLKSQQTSFKRHMYRMKRLKMEANRNLDCRLLTPNGCICLDVRYRLMKMYPTEESTSLNSFLSKAGLNSKEHMPIPEMFKIYKNRDSSSRDEELFNVIKYCVIDAQRCIELIKHENIIQDAIETANISYTSITDSLFRADGMRVINLTIAYGQRPPFNLAISSKGKNTKSANGEEEKVSEKYSGALVIPPKRGLHLPDETKAHAVIAIDFESLYPSIMRCMNMSPDMFIRSDEEAEEFERDGGEIWSISFQYEGVTRTARTVKHNGKIDPKKPDFKMGLFGYVEDMLFARRKQLKDLMGKTTDPYIKNTINVKQKAVKVYMNTFYGVTGSEAQAFYVLEIANGITKWGQHLLLSSIDFVKSNFGVEIFYGDTDSLFMSLNPTHYKDVLQRYGNGEYTRREMYQNICEIAMIKGREIQAKTNEWLLKTFGLFLRVAFEEVLFPACFLSKKKYFGIEHKDKVNFDDPHLLIKGLDTQRRGTPPFMQKILMDIMKDVCRCEFNSTITERCRQAIEEIYSTKYDISQFAIKAKYKESAVTHVNYQFAQRMIQQGNTMKPNEAFSYVLVLRDGVSVKKTSEAMELVENVESQGLTIDVSAYIRKSVIGSIARFCSADIQMENPKNLSYSEMDRLVMRKATEIVENMRLDQGQYSASEKSMRQKQLKTMLISDDTMYFDIRNIQLPQMQTPSERNYQYNYIMYRIKNLEDRMTMLRNSIQRYNEQISIHMNDIYLQNIEQVCKFLKSQKKTIVKELRLHRLHLAMLRMYKHQWEETYLSGV